MIFKTIAFLVLLYFSVKIISRLFLPSRSRQNSKARIFYQVFKNVREQQKQQEEQRKQQESSGNRFEEIEEAEFEEITDENSQSTDKKS